ncbi:translation initiation factor [Chryseobacterium taklimakanense]|uniref:Translation initiation factor n=1 Tax=Chryseobacterium taklimakanense TaxID=536441 RepID=A0A3G8WX16_9FLAO|nr:translation initiation factor [Chryseobacterium taklimakanense]AZI20316.1 translation initiation factor [Chryseobacterium taklimakanense]
MDLRDQLKNLFPDHQEQDFEMPEEKFVQKEPLVCKYEKKGRNGKPVTLIEGFEGSDEELKKISKKIKTTLGIGGSEKDGTIIIQGDNRDKIMEILKNMGYKTKRVGG